MPVTTKILNQKRSFDHSTWASWLKPLSKKKFFELFSLHLSISFYFSVSREMQMNEFRYELQTDFKALPYKNDHNKTVSYDSDYLKKYYISERYELRLTIFSNTCPIYSFKRQVSKNSRYLEDIRIRNSFYIGTMVHIFCWLIISQIKY